MGETPHFLRFQTVEKLLLPGQNGETVATSARATQAVSIVLRCRANARKQELTPDVVLSARLEPPALTRWD